MSVTSSYIDSSFLHVYPQKTEKCSFYSSVTQTGVTAIIKADYDLQQISSQILTPLPLHTHALVAGVNMAVTLLRDPSRSWITHTYKAFPSTYVQHNGTRNTRTQTRFTARTTSYRKSIKYSLNEDDRCTGTIQFRLLNP
jgi:hypothetical protein